MKHGQQTGKQCRMRETVDVWEMNGKRKKICKNRENTIELVRWKLAGVAAVLAVRYL